MLNRTFERGDRSYEAWLVAPLQRVLPGRAEEDVDGEVSWRQVILVLDQQIPLASDRGIFCTRWLAAGTMNTAHSGHTREINGAEIKTHPLTRRNRARRVLPVLCVYRHAD